MTRTLCVALAVVAGACGASPPRGFLIPAPGGHEVEPLAGPTAPMTPIGVDRLVERAAAELELGRVGPGGAAERWVRWALVRDPEHPGALVVAARLAVARGERDEARRLFGLAALREPREVATEQAKNLAALAADELAGGRAARAARLVAELEDELPDAMKALRAERAELHTRIAAAWIERGLREPARAELVQATRLGADVALLELRLDALDKGALQQERARSVVDRAADWRALARWLDRFGRPEDAEWALGEARDEAADDAGNDVLMAELRLGKGLAGEARDAWLAAAARLGPAEAAKALWVGARALEADKHHDEALALVAKAQALAPRPAASEAWTAKRQAVVQAVEPLARGVIDAAAEARAVAAVEAWADPDPDALIELARTLEKRQVLAARAALYAAWERARAVGAEGLVTPAWDALGDLYLKLKRWPDALRAYEAALQAGATGATAEVVAIRLRAEERWDEALRVYDRVLPSELQQTDALIDLTRRYAMRGDRRGAEAAATRLLELGAGRDVQPAKVLALADALVELRLPALAARGYALGVEAGDKTTRTFGGWVRALLRMGDDEGADKVGNRLLGDRAKKDVRAMDELAKVFAEEGRLGRAIDLLSARLADGERFDASVVSPLAELLRRAGRTAEIPALVERFVAAEARAPQRAYQAGAQRLVEAGLVDAARDLLARALDVRPKDPTLLSAALSLAILRRDAASTDGLARRLFGATTAGSAVEIYERVIGDVRAGVGPDVALGLADDALQRVPGAARLLVARGRIHLLAGHAQEAFQDFADALARTASGAAGAGTAREVLDLVAPLLRAARQDEALVALEARAMAQTPGRADIIIPYGKALVAAGEVDDAEQVFARFLADNDRGHAAVAQAWSEAGKHRRALDHWGKGMDQVTDVEAPGVLAAVAQALTQIGAPERLDPFVRLYVQSDDGRQRAGLLPVAQAFATVGRADDALAWLGKAEAATPTADLAFEVGKALLARGDEAGAVAAFERGVARRAAEALPTQSAAWFAGGALAGAVGLLLEEGRPAAIEAARALIVRVEGQHGASGWSRLLAARAAVAADDSGAALEGRRGAAFGPSLRALAGPWPLWRSNRDLLPTFRALLEDLLRRGRGEAAMALVTRSLEAGAERELVMASLRIAGQTGHPLEVAAAGERLWAELPAGQAWLAAEAMAGAGLGSAARPRLEAALGWTPAGLALTRVASADVALGAPVGQVLGAARSVREDAVERAILGLLLHTGSGVAVGPSATGADVAGLDAIGPVLRQSLPDPQVARAVLVAAALTSPERLASVLDALSTGSPDRERWLREAAVQLSQASLPGPALDALDRLAGVDGGEGALALEAVGFGFAAGAPERAAAWAARVPKGAARELTDRYLDVERGDLAPALEGPAPMRLLAARLAQGPGADAARTADAWLAASADEEVDRARCAELALTRLAVGAGWAALGRRCLAPFLAEGGAGRRTLELGLALAWFDGQTGEARALQAELARRFPGALARGPLLVEAAVRAGDADGLRAVLATPLGMTQAERVRAAAQALAAVALDGGAAAAPRIAPAVLEVLEAEALAAPAADPDAAEVLVAVARARGDERAARAAAEAAWERAPRAPRLVLLAARTLAATDAKAADALVAELARRPAEPALFDLDAKASASAQRAELLATLAELAAARHDAARAAALYQRALTSPDLDAWRVGTWLVARGDALAAAGQAAAAAGAYTDAARRGVGEPWARAARARLAARSAR